MANPIQAVKAGDAGRKLIQKRFETGRVVSVSGDKVSLDVGYHHPDGSSEYLELPYSDCVPKPGQTACIVYPNDNPNGAYVVATAELAQYDPKTVSSLFAIPLCAFTSLCAAPTKLSAVKNQSGTTLVPVGVSVVETTGGAGNVADLRIGGTSILTGTISISATAGTIATGTLDGTLIQPDDEIQLYYTGAASKFVQLTLFVTAMP